MLAGVVTMVAVLLVVGAAGGVAQAPRHPAVAWRSGQPRGRLAIPSRPVTPIRIPARTPVPAHAVHARTKTAHQRRARHVLVGNPVYTGLAFDACSAPSAAQMRAWRSSPFRAVGIYVGGSNRACPQPNLSADWVRRQVADGWHLLPIWVGPQAPSNACGCEAIDPHRAAQEGSAAAMRAVDRAEALGIRNGNPIYFDIEAYDGGGRRTAAVLTFLGAWTARLHADGYRSGVYSSGRSGIRDLAGRWGTRYPEPDDVWFADWDGTPNTHSPSLPRGAWLHHGRLHQFDGNRTASYGGVTLTIDRTFIDGDVVA